MDVKIVFLYVELKKYKYVTQPQGFIISMKKNMVYKLQKIIYELQQASRAWYEKIDSFLKGSRFQEENSDYNLYSRKSQGHIILIALYVDDLLMIGSYIKNIIQFKNLLHKKFEGKVTISLKAKCI